MHEALGWSGTTAKEIIPINMITKTNTSKEKLFIILSGIRTRPKKQ